ncbi:MAG TPA: acetyl-CoA carboxylase biotin carboxyl carrier protein subunit [Chloroflexota bacterium]|jgi:biotin carboxyl carrier protein|nr:acetyl-CoA carboxylase biotin carboxyl carrier protein subunit [Chloroflexota bacterium]
MPTYQVTIGERTLKVSLRRDGDAAYASLDNGPEVKVQLDALHGALYSLALDGMQKELLARRSENEVELTIAGLGYRAEVLDEAHARLAQVAGGRGGSHGRRELKAPMPGLVVKVLAVVGDSVEPHQPLIVLQAMKMENELTLPRGGTVSAVSVQSGHTVEAGQVLVALED